MADCQHAPIKSAVDLIALYVLSIAAGICQPAEAESRLDLG
jgi:hypothetical protein